jgi:hypothetical protein
MATFGTTARINVRELVTAYKNGSAIKLFKHPGGWSVECNAGVLADAGTDQFSALEPLVTSLKDAGVDRMTLEP